MIKRDYWNWTGVCAMALVVCVDGGGGASWAASVADLEVRRDPIVRAVERVLPSVVNISTETLIESQDAMDDLFREFFGPHYRLRPPNAQKSLGSGVIIDETGYLLTNFHVVRRATRITVTFSDGRERDATLLSALEASDVALLKIQAQGGELFAAVRFAAADDLLLGETVIALGNPFGLGASVSRGILSSRSRRPPTENVPLDIADWLQTDAAINPGNSGGPLVNAVGELIGLNVAVFREGQGIGFAIPTKRVQEALNEVFSPEALRSIWLGVRIVGAGSALKVGRVESGSPAEKGGLREGDGIVSVNGTAPTGWVQLMRDVVGWEDRKQRWIVERRGERRSLDVQPVPERDFFTPALIRQKLGATLQPMNPEVAREFGLAGGGGFVVESVEGGGPADRAELRRGVILQAFDGQVLHDTVQVAKWLYRRPSGDRVRVFALLPVQRGPLVQLFRKPVDVVLR